MKCERRSLWIVVCVLIASMMAGPPCTAWAQGATATVHGVIVDDSGGVVPDVEVKLLNLDTGLERTVTAGDEGTFTAPLLPPGDYQVTARREGFTPAEIRRLTLNAGDQLNVRLALKVGRVGEEVTVTADAGRVSTSPGVSTVVDQQFVKNLPLNGRSFQRLIQLSPGVVPVTAAYGGGEFSINGQRANANYFTIDGVSANAGMSGYAGGIGNQMNGSTAAATADGGTNTLVSLEAIQEFTIQTSAFAPEFGRMPGGQIGITTRSGSNAYHGSASVYFRDDALDATDWFVNQKGLAKPPLRLWDVGGTFGGPVRANRMFFFGSYEDLRLDRPGVAITDVPSRAARAAAAPALRELLDAFPQPTGLDQANGLAEFAGAFTNPSRSKSGSLRLDGVVGGVTWFGRYSAGPSSKAERNVGGSWSANTATRGHSRLDSVTAGSTQSWSSNVANDLRVNYTRSSGSTDYALDEYGGAVLPSAGVEPPTSYGSARLYARLDPSGRGSVILDGIVAGNLAEQVNVVDTLSVARGSHQFRFGADYRALMPTLAPLQYSLSYTIGLASVSSGVIPSATIETRPDASYPRFHNLSLFAQDTWQTTRRLTLTYGLRWELNPPPSERDGHDAYAVTGADDRSTMSLAPRGTPLWQTRYANLAPRLAAAYRLSDAPGRETIVRAAAGLFHDLGTGQASRGYEFYHPYVISKRLSNAPFPLSSAALEPATESLPPYAAFGIDPQLETPVTYQWNAALERSLGSTQTLTISYVGAAGRHLLRMTRDLEPNPTFWYLDYLDDNASSEYHALQAQYRRRLSAGLQTSAAYTWGRATDNDSQETFRVGSDGTTSQADLRRGPSDFDARHSLSAAVTYLVPSASTGLLSAIAGGWSVDAIVVGRTALPVNLQTNGLLHGVPIGQRPNIVPGVPWYLDDPAAPGGRRINRAAFSMPGPDRQGDLPRNALRGFSAFQIDLALRRRFPLWSTLAGQLGIELFNLTNRPNFDSPVVALASTQFGVAAQTLATGLGSGRNPLYQLGGPRSIQLSLKVEF